MTADDLTRTAPMRVRSQNLARELYALRCIEDAPTDAGVRRALRGRRA